MQPLSPTIRRLYLALFIVLFTLIIPAAIFFADGWRYRANYGFVRTGGIYLAVPYADASIFLNGVAKEKSGFLDHNFYFGDLAPSAYIVHIEKPGYLPWDRLLVVDEQLVTDARAVLIPRETPALKIVATTTVATTTINVSRATLDSYAAIFAATTSASSTLPVDQGDGIGLFLEKGALIARWITKDAFSPSQFCGRPSVCTPEIVLEDEVIVSRAYFFRGGVVYATKAGDIRFKEIDIRDAPVAATIFKAKNSDIRIIDDAIIVKSGKEFYRIDF